MLNLKRILIIMIMCLLLGSCAKSIIGEEVDEFTISIINSDLEERVKNNEVESLLGREVIFENVETKEDVVRNVESIWIEFYGEELIKSERPYNISFDADRNLWFVCGSFNYDYDVLGGVAYAVVSKESGKLLVMGHFE